jgi:hypothetical protein
LNVTAILSELKAEQQRIDNAIAALEALDGIAFPDSPPQAVRPAKAPKKKKRHMSAEGKARIIAAAKKRWAAFNAAKAAEKPVKKARVMSPATRRKIAAAARARWAKIKAAKA